MAIIETKYNIGDIVYKGDSTNVTEYIECPDCLGSKIVHITFADNRVEELDCYTCRTCGFPEFSSGSLSFKGWFPRVRKGIVTSLEFRDKKVTYNVNYGWESYEGKSYEAIYHDDENKIHSDEEKALVDAIQETERYTAGELTQIFKKKGSFAKSLEQSHLGMRRKDALKAERDMNRWVKIIKER